MNKPNIYLI